MKTKPILITTGVLVLLAGAFLFIRSRNLVKPQKDEIVSFLKQLNQNLVTGKIDSVKNAFEIDQHSKIVDRLVKLLSNRDPGTGKENKLFKLALDIDKAEIILANSDLAQVKIPVIFSNEKLSNKYSLLILKIHNVSANQLKIVQADIRELLTDYYLYKKAVESSAIADKDRFSPITLAAFKVASQLKGKYDSVLYFQHIGDKTYYYVAKGHFVDYSSSRDPKDKDSYKTGLVDPDMKEIVPVEYDVIHNIGGTFDGLIELEQKNKKGYCDINGKIIVPVNYEQAIPITDESNLGLLRKGDDYFYLKKDLTISDKLIDFKIKDVITKIRDVEKSYEFSEKGVKNIMEYNSRDYSSSIILPPSYLVEWSMLPSTVDLPNPLRKPVNNEVEEEDGHLWFKVNYDGHKTEEKGWLESVYYSIVDNYLGSRSGLYETKNVLLVDNKSNKILGFGTGVYYGLGEGGGELSGKCNDSYLRQINDTLLEFKTTAELDRPINGVYIEEGPHYHYLRVVDGKLVALPDKRLFSFTQYVKMDDSYLSGCYLIDKKQADKITPEILQYIKNEIYASYGYKFKSEKWTKEFESSFDRYDGAKNANVDDSLTVIDKYNINWISQKLKEKNSNTLAAK